MAKTPPTTEASTKRPQVAAIVRRVPAAPVVSARKMTAGQYAQLWESGQESMWGGGGSLSAPADPMRQSLWFSVCVTEISTSGSQVPLRLSVGDAAGTRAIGSLKHVRSGRQRDRRPPVRGEKAAFRAAEGDVVEGGDFYELLERPNPEQTLPQFVRQMIGLLYVHGRVHVVYDEMIGRRPVAMYCIPGNRTTPIVDDTGRVRKLRGWMLDLPDGRREPITLDECLTFQLFDPEDRHRGISPREPGRLAIVSDLNASTYNAASFGNSAEPGVALRTDADFDPELDAQMRTSWNQRHRGAANAKALAILWGGLTMERISSTMAEMVWPDGKRLSREEICAICRVPPSIAGFLGTTGDSSAYTDHEERRYWQGTMFPLLNQIAEGFETTLAPVFASAGRLEVWFDAEHVPIVAKMRLSVLPAVETLHARGVPLADLSDLYDLGLPARPQHEVGFLPAGLIPARDVLDGTATPPVDEGPSAPGNDALDQSTDSTDSTEGEEEDGDNTPASASAPAPLEKSLADRIWAAWSRSWSPLANAMRGFLRGRYARQERAVIAEIKKRVTAENNSNGTSSSSAIAEAYRKADVVARILMEVFDEPMDRDAFRVRVRSFISDAGELGVRQALIEAGLAGDALESAVRQLMSNPAILAELGREAVKVSTLVDGATRRILKRQLAQGLEGGETIKKLADRVQLVMGNRRQAALGVARNAIGQTLSMARHAGHLASGMTHKYWIHSRGPGERRPAHVAAEARYRADPIPLTQPFTINGAELMYPRDFASGHPEETVNCQCLQIALRKTGDQPAQRFFGYRDLLAGRTTTKDSP